MHQTSSGKSVKAPELQIKLRSITGPPLARQAKAADRQTGQEGQGLLSSQKIVRSVDLLSDSMTHSPIHLQVVKQMSLSAQQELHNRVPITFLINILFRDHNDHV